MNKILAIDDKRDNLTTLSALLRNLLPDCLVSTAQSGREGIEKAVVEQPDVILLDVKMPDMDGFDTCQRLKSDQRTSAIPVIMITAIKTDQQSRIKGLDLGADAFLAKPIDETELVSQVKVALRIKRAEDALRRERDCLEEMVAQRTRELQENENNYRLLFESAGGAIYIHDEEARILAVNTTACQLLDYTETELLSMTMAQIVDKAHYDPARIARLMERGKLRFTSVHRCKHGGTVAVEVNSRRIIWAARPAMMSVCRDISEKQRLESEREILITAIEQAPVAIALTDPDGNIQYVNPAFEKISGYSGSELLGENPRILKSGRQDQKFYTDLWRTITGGQVWKGRMTNKRKDGSLYVEEATISPVLDNQGRVTNFVAIKRDITAELEMEDRLRQAQKMEAIGTLAGGIAHDFNNILGAIIGYSEMIRDDALAASASVADINQVLKAGHRAKDLVKQILAFSRQAIAEPIPVQPAAIIKEAIKLLRASLPTTIDIMQDLDAEAGVILADPTHIHQIMMNLCTNAFHAMEMRGGTLTVGLCKKTLSEQEVGGDRYLQPGEYVRLSIGDSGVGIAPEIREKIFEPYFTTKEIGKGTGMGLATVHGIVRSYGGAISCESRLGEGTVFYITLPIIETKSILEVEPVATVLFGKEHILLVDDEEILLEMSKTMLDRLGYQVTARTMSIEALTTFQNEPKSFDLVLCDQTMPGMTGVDLSRRILQIRPDMPIILCTGYSNLISEEKAKSMGIRGFAMKPLAKSDIAVLIRKVLDGGKSLGVS
ncbi:MAG: response regulator [Pseudomonadota bacterium]